MWIEPLIFYAAAFVLLGAGLLVITTRNTVYAALFLVLAFFASAVLWMLLEAEFLALVLVLVYVGAVMTLFLFVLMMLNMDLSPEREGFVRYLPYGIVLMALMLAGIFMVVKPSNFGLGVMPAPPPAPANFSNVANLGDVLYTHYVYPFELAAVLLLIAIIAAIGLSLRKPRGKLQNITKQQEVRRQDRVRLVEMDTEKKHGLND